MPDAEIIWRPHPDSPQERFLASSCFEVLYGGQAGGGKTDAMVMAPLRWVEHSQFRAIIFRRTWPELKRSVLERAWKYYPKLGAFERDGGREWHWPSGAIISLGSMERVEDRMKYSSAEFQFVGFEELSTFEEDQYTFMLTRMRSSAGIPQRLRANTNPPPPGSPGDGWIIKRFGPWIYRPNSPNTPPEYTGPFADPHQVLYTVTDEETGASLYVPKGTQHALGRTFIPASLYDNPSVNPAEYEAKLRAAGTDPVTMKQLLKGDWFASGKRGSYFRREWFHFDGGENGFPCPRCKQVHPPGSPANVIMRVRIWDRAATEEAPGTDPDWTSGTLMALDHDRNVWVEDQVRFRAGPGEVEKRILATAALDASQPGTPTTIALLHDPAAAGKFEMASYIAKLGAYHVVPIAVPNSNKLVMGRPWSGAVSNGRVFIVRAPWNAAFIAEHEAVPNGSHDDQFDTGSNGYRFLHGVAGVAKGYGASGEEQKRAAGIVSMHRSTGGF